MFKAVTASTSSEDLTSDIATERGFGEATLAGRVAVMAMFSFGYDRVLVREFVAKSWDEDKDEDDDEIARRLAGW
jgi:hypothetical protein